MVLAMMDSMPNLATLLFIGRSTADQQRESRILSLSRAPASNEAATGVCTTEAMSATQGVRVKKGWAYVSTNDGCC